MTKLRFRVFDRAHPYRPFSVVLVLLAVFLLVVVLSPVLIHDVFFRMPSPSDQFDCDDGTLVMLDRLENLGISATPMLGKLTATGETYLESDHVWVLAKIGPFRIPFDWGKMRSGKQYYEGYPINREQLLTFVAQDRQAPGAGNEYPAVQPESTKQSHE